MEQETGVIDADALQLRMMALTEMLSQANHQIESNKARLSSMTAETNRLKQEDQRATEARDAAMKQLNDVETDFINYKLEMTLKGTHDILLIL